jgi:excisionase family DNA binding protein
MSAQEAQSEIEHTVQDLAQKWRVSERAIQKWIAEGSFPNAYKVGLGKNSHWRIPNADVLAFEQQRRK